MAKSKRRENSERKKRERLGRRIVSRYQQKEMERRGAIFTPVIVNGHDIFNQS